MDKNTTSIIKIDENIYIKLEGDNPNGSIYDRVVTEVMSSYELSGKIKNDTTIISSSDGYFGLCLAVYCHSKNYKCIICMPNEDNPFIEKVKELGCTVVLTPALFGLSGSDEMASDMACEIKDSLYFSQFKEKKCVTAHFKSTGPEILQQLPSVDIIIGNITSGATITGVSKYLKMKKDIYSIGIRTCYYKSDIIDEDYIDEIISLGNEPICNNDEIKKHHIYTKYPELIYKGLECKNNSTDKNILIILPDGRVVNK
ncbi:MAG: pyridoxal-phosphate dependent enzyme [Anaeroplasma sp.]